MNLRDCQILSALAPAVPALIALVGVVVGGLLGARLTFRNQFRLSTLQARQQTYAALMGKKFLITQAAADAAPTNAAPFETELLETLRAMADQQKAANEQNNAGNKSWDSPSMLVQIGLFVVGAGYTIFAALQWSAIKRQAAITEAGIEVARVAANAAEESAKAVDAQLGLLFGSPLRPAVSVLESAS
jgi:hypothetical protein